MLNFKSLFLETKKPDQGGQILDFNYKEPIVNI